MVRYFLYQALELTGNVCFNAIPVSSVVLPYETPVVFVRGFKKGWTACDHAEKDYTKGEQVSFLARKFRLFNQNLRSLEAFCAYLVGNLFAEWPLCENTKTEVPDFK